jgi:hypothetical protein
MYRSCYTHSLSSNFWLLSNECLADLALMEMFVLVFSFLIEHILVIPRRQSLLAQSLAVAISQMDACVQMPV